MITVEELIARMEKAGESDDNIALAVNEFETQQNEGKQIDSKKDATVESESAASKNTDFISEDGFLVSPYDQFESVQDRIYTQGQQGVIFNNKIDDVDPGMTYLGQTYQSYKNEGIDYGDVTLSDNPQNPTYREIDGIVHDVNLDLIYGSPYGYSPEHPNYQKKKDIWGDWKGPSKEEIELFEKKLFLYEWDKKGKAIMHSVLSEEQKEFLANNPALFITSRKMHAQEIVDEGLPLNVNAEDIAKDFTLNNMLEYHDTWNSKEMEAFLAKGAFELDKEYKDLVKPVRDEILNAVQEKYKSQIDPIRNSIVEEYQKIFTKSSKKIAKTIENSVLKKFQNEINKGLYKGWSQNELQEEFAKRYNLAINESEKLKALEENTNSLMNEALKNNPKLNALNKTMQDEFEKDWGLATENNDFQEKYHKFMQNAWIEHANKLSPYNLISEDTYGRIDQAQDRMGFSLFTYENKETALNNMWAEAKKSILNANPELTNNPEQMLKYQTEFFARYYKKLATVEIEYKDKDGNIVKAEQWSQFILKDYSNEVLKKIDGQIAAAIKERDKWTAEKYGTHGMGQWEGLKRPEEISEGAKKWNEANDLVIKLKRIKEYANTIIDNPEELELSGSWGRNFGKGFTSGNWHDYVPFISGIVDLSDANRIKQIAEKAAKIATGEIEGALNAEEEMLLKMYQMKGISDGYTRELGKGWNGYNAGKLTREMIPYIGEFIATSGAFSATRTLAQKTMTKAFLGKSVADINRQLGSKTLTKEFAKKTGGSVKGLKFNSKAINATSWLLGTAAQATVNPQHYVKHAVEFMTPQSYLMLSEEGDDIVAAIDLNSKPMGGFEAAWKGWGLTWVEFGTERMGELIPGLGKYIRKDIMKDPDWMKRLMLSHWLRKNGYTKAAAINKFRKDKMGWNGFAGEMFEEIINMPLSNLIMGQPVLEGGWVPLSKYTDKNPELGAWDWNFYQEMGQAIGVTSLGFSGFSLATMNYTGNPTYQIGWERYDNVDDFWAEIDRLEAEGAFEDVNREINIRIDNDFLTVDALEERLDYKKFQNKNNNVSSNEGTLSDAITASEVEVVNSATNEENTAINEQEEELDILNDELAAVEADPNISAEEKQKIKTKIQNEIDGRKIIINSVLDKVRKRVEKGKREEFLLNRVKKAQVLQKKAGVKVNWEIGNTIEHTEELVVTDIKRQIKSLRSALAKTKDSKKQKKIQAEINSLNNELNRVDAEGKPLKPGEGVIEQARTGHGFISPDGKTIIINKESSLNEETGNINVAVHEFLHKAMFATFKNNPNTQLAVGKALHGYVMSLDPKQMRRSKFRQRLLAYHENAEKLLELNETWNQQRENGDMEGAAKTAAEFAALEADMSANQAEETLNLLSDAIFYGELVFNETLFTKLGDIFRRVLRQMGVKAKFKTGRDVFNFIKDFNRSIEKGELSKGMIRSLTEGIEVDIKEPKKKTKKAKTKTKTEPKKYKASLPAFTTDQKEDMFTSTRDEVDNILKTGMLGKTIDYKGYNSLFDMPIEMQEDIWRNQLNEENRKLIGYMIGSNWRNWIAGLADEKYDRIPGWEGFRNEFLDRITQGLESEDNGLPFLVNTWLQDVEEGVKPATLTSHIFGNLPLRMPHTTRTISGFGLTEEYQEGEDLREESDQAEDYIGQNKYRAVAGIKTNSKLYNDIKNFALEELSKIDFAKALAIDANEKDRLKAQKKFRQLLEKQGLKFKADIQKLIGTQKSDEFKEHLGKHFQDIPALFGVKYTTRFKGENSLVESKGEMNTDQSIASQVSIEGSFVTNKHAGNEIWVPKNMSLKEIMDIFVEGRETQYKSYVDALTSEVFLDSLFEVINDNKLQNALTHAALLAETIKRQPSYLFSKGMLDITLPFPPDSKVVEDIYTTLGISLKHPWGSKIWEEETHKAGVDIGSIAYMEYEEFDKYFQENPSGYKTPLRLAFEASWQINEEISEIMDIYFSEVMNKTNSAPKEQLAEAMSELIDILPPQLVRKLGKPFFTLIGSDRLLGGKNFRMQWLIDKYNNRIKQPDTDIELDFDIEGIEIINANMGLALKIQEVLSLPESEANADQKQAIIEEGPLGQRILNANINNPKALKFIMQQVLSLLSNSKISLKAKAGLVRWMEVASNNTKGQRALTTLGAIDYTNASQAPFVGINSKGEVVAWFAKRPNQKELELKKNKNVVEVKLNEQHPSYTVAAEITNTQLGYRLTQNKKDVRNVWQNEAVFNKWYNNSFEKMMAERLRFKGEHVQPSANTMRDITIAMFNTFNDLSVNPDAFHQIMDNFNEEYERIVREFYQTLAVEVKSFAIDQELGTTSEANTARLLALEKIKGLNLSSYRGTGTTASLQGVGLVKQLMSNTESIQAYRELLNTIKAENLGETKKFQILDRAYMFSKKVNPTKGISIWDFDDTIARTKSGVRARIPNPDGTPKPGRKVIFLAGGAGSGKSNVVKQLGLEEQGFKVVNSDISLEWLKKNHGLPTDMRDLTREQLSQLGKLQWQARKIAERKKGKFKGQGSGIIIDGTGASMNVMNKQVQEFQAAGYDVQMIFVETSLEVALERNKARKERSLIDIILRKNHEAVQANKAGFKKLFGDNFAEVNTDNLKQNDPMPTKLVDQLNTFTTSYEKRRLTAEEFAAEGSTILEKGGEFDFTEFDLVVQGETGPLFGKAINRAKKFGTRHQFILTARPHAAKNHIYEFLKSQGLDIPLENIITLENSTSEAKALWVAEKVGEGYNDFYFADDHLENVDAVKNILSQFDVKSDVQQAKYKFSKDASKEFNEILEQSTGMKAASVFSAAKARKRGAKPKFRFFIPPSAEDFKGLLYQFLAEGELGEQQMAWFKEHLLDPFARGYRDLNTAKQVMSNDYRALKKAMPAVYRQLRRKIEGTDFTYEDAVRVYLFTKSGYDMTEFGLSKSDTRMLVSIIETSNGLKAFANTLKDIIKRPEGYLPPNELWLAGSILKDIHDATHKIGRAGFLAEWIQNKDLVFSKANLNKIEAIYGTDFRSALEDMLWRMENGTNRTSGDNKLVNQFQNWLKNSVGTIMFFNTRSAILQTLSTVNFINWGDNNLAKAAIAFANQPQFWKDFAFLFNSDMLKQRRAGLKTDVNDAELTQSISKSDNKVLAALNWLLQKGFLPTQIADSFAIASGGATFYRNRVNTYIKQGLSQEEAEKKAFVDFQEIAEETQQSARPDMISQQQASVLGRIILAFQNTPMQYMRLSKKALMDLAAGRGDVKTNISKIVYYTTVQNLIFYSLQSALFALAFDDDEDEKERDKNAEKKKMRVLNGMLDTILRGTGIYGAVVSTIKNVLIKFGEQEEKTWGKDYSAVLVEALNLSPPLGSKARKLISAQKTWDYNRDIVSRMDWYDINNPMWGAFGNVVSATTNIPMDRLVNKTLNIQEALNDNNETWQRVALSLGWNRWDLGVQDQEVNRIKDIIKIEKKELQRKEKLLKKYPGKTEAEIVLLKKTEEIKNLKKLEQVRILKKLGLKDKEISNLKLEKSRVEKIMNIYKEDSKKVEDALKYNKNYKPTKQEQRSIDLFKMKKQDQVNMLMDFGLTPKQIRGLKLEKDRVNKIIEFENKKK